MGRAEVCRSREALLPVVDSLVGQAVHEVDADVVEPGGARHPVCLDGVSGRVTPSEKAKQAVIEALDADAEAIDAGVEKVVELVGGEIPGVCFESDLRLVLEGKGLADSRHQAEMSLEGR